ncbi:DedA family protein [Micromonospora sp. DR5-3]|uniref:DedA family protein n=1 Tax=unclassified Micromonospora TaxID=2617518 RepID=UPI0011D49348|nr:MULTISPECIES: DedA family protein [unclassified Micromonospora]MCW3820454.1 DedA family protein [Micromonospora sp. DR5-3]TYC10158.1 DedA family protein [Micromonospora sp. MP36]
MIHSWHVSMYAEVLAGPAESPDDGLVGFVTDLVERLGGPGAGLAVALENLFPPIPSEVILPLAGFTASQGKMNLFHAIGWTTLGSVIGALALYYVGVVLGRDRVRSIAAKLPLVKLDDIDRTEAWFARHGAKAVFFGRMIPIFRSLISIPAGIERMPVAGFLLYTTLGSLIWNTVFVVAGYLLGENWHAVESYAGTLQNLVIAACALAVAYFAISRLMRMRRSRLAADGARTVGALESGAPKPPAEALSDLGAHRSTRAGRGTLYGTPRRGQDDDDLWRRS